MFQLHLWLRLCSSNLIKTPVYARIFYETSSLLHWKKHILVNLYLLLQACSCAMQKGWNMFPTYFLHFCFANLGGQKCQNHFVKLVSNLNWTSSRNSRKLSIGRIVILRKLWFTLKHWQGMNENVLIFKYFEISNCLYIN